MKGLFLLDLCFVSKFLILSFTGLCRLIHSGLLPHFLFTLVKPYCYPKRETSVGDSGSEIFDLMAILTVVLKQYRVISGCIHTL